MKRAKRIWMTVFLAMAVVALGAGGLQLLAVRGTFAEQKSPAEAHGEAIKVGFSGHQLAGRAFVNGSGVANPLVVVLHGDAPFANPSYQYKFASDVARAAPGSAVVALLRPGYKDPYGARSDGDRGFASGENYTADVADDVIAALQVLKAKYRAASIILVGHSGGAAIAADVAARSGRLVQQVFLVGCPCNVTAFRWHMARLQWSPIWLLPVSSLSPDLTLDQMDRATAITAISGSRDAITLPEYAQAYIDKALARGIAASMIIAPDQGHEILNSPAVLQRVIASARN
jgi:pimeloyl-ACP methyl ester carboxylesterase